MQLFITLWIAAHWASLFITTPGACSNSWPLSQWCHPTISSSVIPFSYIQSFPSSGSFPMSQFFASGGPSIGASASASVLPMNFRDWSPLGWTGWISSQSKGLSRVFSNTTVQKHQFFGAQLSLWFNSHISHVVPIHSGILLSHKKECIWLSSNEVDEPRAYYTEWSKSEKQISYSNAYIWNSERWYW